MSAELELFKTVFPKYAKLWDANQIRIDHFEEYTKLMHKNAQSVSPASLPSLREMNQWGFFTTDSQEGVYSYEENPVIVTGPRKGEPIKSAEGSPATKYTLLEFAYVDGVIPKELYQKVIAKLKSKPHLYFYNFKLGQNQYWHPTLEFGQFANQKLDRGVFPLRKNPSLNHEHQEEILFHLTLPLETNLKASSYGDGMKELMPLRFLTDLGYWIPVYFFDSRAGYNANLPDGLFTVLNEVLAESLRELNAEKQKEVAKTSGGRRRRWRKTRKVHPKHRKMTQRRRHH